MQDMTHIRARTALVGSLTVVFLTVWIKDNLQISATTSLKPVSLRQMKPVTVTKWTPVSSPCS